MATRFSHSAEINGSLEALHAAYADEAFWRDRVATVGTPKDTLDSFSAGPDGIEVVVTQHIPDSDIPDLARKVLKGELTIVRTTTYAPFHGGDIATGKAKAVAAGGLGSITGEGEAVRDGADGCVESLTGSVKISVPLLGGKLEKLAVDYLQQLFEAEYAQANRWLEAR